MSAWEQKKTWKNSGRRVRFGSVRPFIPSNALDRGIHPPGILRQPGAAPTQRWCCWTASCWRRTGGSIPGLLRGPLPATALPTQEAGFHLVLRIVGAGAPRRAGERRVGFSSYGAHPSTHERGPNRARPSISHSGFSADRVAGRNGEALVRCFRLSPLAPETFRNFHCFSERTLRMSEPVEPFPGQLGSLEHPAQPLFPSPWRCGRPRSRPVVVDRVGGVGKERCASQPTTRQSSGTPRKSSPTASLRTAGSSGEVRLIHDR
jgi:hypothetical protein